MKNVLLTLVSCAALSACTAYPAKRPPASAYIRPVRPPGWTTNPTREQVEREAEPDRRRAYATLQVLEEQRAEREARTAQMEAREQQQRQIEAIEGIQDEIRSLPRRQYIWAD